MILDKCYFCLSRVAEEKVEDQGEVFYLCPSCAQQFRQALENADKNPIDLPRNNASDICCKCGLCCVALVAQVEEEEVDKLIAQSNATGRYPRDVTTDQFCSISDHPSYEGKLVMNFPCIFLKGSVLSYTRCGAYDLDRPSVCGSYLCKVAVRYKLGLISLGEAQFLLRSSFMTGDVSIFNWTEGGADPESPDYRLNTLLSISRYIDQVKAAGIEGDELELAVAHHMTPEYVPESAVSRALLNMHLYAVDREDFKLELYVEPDVLGAWNEDNRSVAEHTMKAVLRDIRRLFYRTTRGDEDDTEIPRDDGREGTIQGDNPGCCKKCTEHREKSGGHKKQSRAD